MQELSFPLLNHIRESNLNLYKSANLPVYSFNDCLYSESGIAHPLLNGIIYGMPKEHEIEAFLSRVVGHYESKKLPFCFWSEANLETEELSLALKNKGFQLLGCPKGMSLLLENYRPKINLLNNVHIRIANEKMTCDSWNQVLSEVFQIPFPRAYGDLFHHKENIMNVIGIINETIVATGTLILKENMANIYNISTLENFRGKGIAESIFHYLIDVGLKKGAQGAILTSMPLAEPLYKRIGFETAFHYNLYQKLI